jgi:hypothetical protein
MACAGIVCSQPLTLLLLDTGLIDNGFEHRNFLGDARPGSIAALRPYQEANLVELRFCFRRGEDLERFPLDLLDNVGRRLGWCQSILNIRYTIALYFDGSPIITVVAPSNASVTQPITPARDDGPAAFSAYVWEDDDGK